MIQITFNWECLPTHIEKRQKQEESRKMSTKMLTWSKGFSLHDPTCLPGSNTMGHSSCYQH